jgi:hypothetical protein
MEKLRTQHSNPHLKVYLFSNHFLFSIWNSVKKCLNLKKKLKLTFWWNFCLFCKILLKIEHKNWNFRTIWAKDLKLITINFFIKPKTRTQILCSQFFNPINRADPRFLVWVCISEETKKKGIKRHSLSTPIVWVQIQERLGFHPWIFSNFPWYYHPQ